MAEATALFTWLRRRRTLGGIGLTGKPAEALPPADKRADPASRLRDTVLDPSRDGGGEKMNITQLAPVAGPEGFVRLDAPEQVEFIRAFVDGHPNREAHQHEADAVLLELVVEAVLVEIERPVMEEAVHHR